METRLQGNNMKRYGLLGLLFVLLFIFLILCPSQSVAQFKGKNKKITEDQEVTFSDRYRSGVLVAAKNSFGLFWVDKSANLWFARIRKSGKLKGKVLLVTDGTSRVSAVWTGKFFVLALSKRTDDGEWLVHLVNVNERGKVISKYVIIQPNGNLWMSVTLVACAWNGKYVGVAYRENVFNVNSKSGIYFQVVDTNLKKKGARTFIADSTSTQNLNCASSEGEFAVCYQNDSKDGGAFIQRLSEKSTKLGNPEKFVEKLFGWPDMEYITFISTDTGNSTDTRNSTGNGYLLAYDTFDNGIRHHFLDKDLNSLKGPFTPVSRDERGRQIYLGRRDNEIWAFWGEWEWYETRDRGRLVNGVAGVKTTTDGEVIEESPILTDTSQMEEYPFGVASLGKIVMLAIIQFVPDEDTNEKGTIFARKMKK